MKKGIIALSGLLAGTALAVITYRNTRRRSRAAVSDRRITTRAGAEPQMGAAIDLNHCDVQQIMALPGIDSTLATRILDNRPYRTKFDLLERFIIPEDVFQQIRRDIRVQYAPAA